MSRRRTSRRSPPTCPAARAEAVKQALVTTGVKPNRIDVEGHGAEEPVTDNDTPRGRLANRRVEIKLYVPQRR